MRGDSNTSDLWTDLFFRAARGNGHNAVTCADASPAGGLSPYARSVLLGTDGRNRGTHPCALPLHIYRSPPEAPNAILWLTECCLMSTAGLACFHIYLPYSSSSYYHHPTAAIIPAAAHSGSASHVMPTVLRVVTAIPLSPRSAVLPRPPAVSPCAASVKPLGRMFRVCQCMCVFVHSYHYLTLTSQPRTHKKHRAIFFCYGCSLRTACWTKV